MATQKASYGLCLAEGTSELRDALDWVSDQGYKLITVTQTGLLYTVIYRRKAHG